MAGEKKEERDLQKFLKDVDEITNLIQGLNSKDPAVQEKAVADTESKLHAMEVGDEERIKTRLNRTKINSRAPVRNSFLAALEKDAQERASRRKENEGLANALKERGNEAFREGDYATAIRRYTEGLEKQKDMKALYINRAQRQWHA
uniref:Tetratricopeptide repeat protein 12 n=1 Tax=Sphenodon punctatus TaxID=8508 RepID=A0A8D0H0N4_SPHPU